MSDASNYVKSGLWFDFELPSWNGYQLLIHDDTAFIISNAIAIALAFSLPRLLVLLKLLWPHILLLLSRASKYLRDISVSISVQIRQRLRKHHLPLSVRWPEPLGIAPPTSDIGLADIYQADATTSSSRILSGAALTFQESTSFGDAVLLFASRHLAMRPIVLGTTRNSLLGTCKYIIQNMQEDPLGFITVLTIISIFFALFLSVQIAAISSSYIVTTSIAMSINPSCGWWVPTSERLSIPKDLDRQTILLSQPGQRAIQYAENCYRGKADFSQCSVFFNSTLTYNEIYNAKCPFDEDICLGNSAPAYTLDTGFLDSSNLGINSAARFQFRRKTTCAPVVTNDTYVEHYYNSFNQKTVIYDYGCHENGINRTFRDIYNNGSALKEMYGYHITRVQGPRSSFEPNTCILRPEFRSRGAAVTLLLVRQFNLYYFNRSDDYIFPAQELFTIGNLSGGPWYINSEKKSPVLGCADAKEIRDPISGKEWYLLNDQLHEKGTGKPWSIPISNFSGLQQEQKQQPYDAKALQTLKLIGISMKFSDIYSTLLFQSEHILDAQRKIRTIISLPLDQDQWKIEVRRTFEISLARMQVDLLGIAEGRGATAVSVFNQLGNSSADICNMIKFQAIGWKNISVVGLVSLLGLCAMLHLSTLKVGESILVHLSDYVGKSIVPGILLVVNLIYDFTLGYFQQAWEVVVNIWHYMKGT